MSEKTNDNRNQTPVDQNNPLWLSWLNYQKSFDYANTRKWALHEAHVEGSLWGAYSAGFAAASLAAFTPAEPHGK